MGKATEKLEEKVDKIVTLTESLSKMAVQTRKLITELMEHQTRMLKNQMALMNEVKATRADINQLRHAILFVFEMVAGTEISTSGTQRASRHLNDLADGGIKALAEHNTREALSYIAKIKAAGGK